MRFRRQVPWAVRSHRGETRLENGPESAPDDGQAAPYGRGPSVLRTVTGRRLLRDAAIILGTFGVGYVIASAWLSPVPLLTTDHAVPRVLELTGGAAQRKLVSLGFRVKFDDPRPNPTVPQGAIVWQDPAPGTVLGQNSIVTLAPSAGRPLVPVPDITGFPLPYALKVLAAAGLKPGDVDTVASDPEPGLVVATRPGAGVGREPGSTVDLVVSGQPGARSQAAHILRRPVATGARP